MYDVAYIVLGFALSFLPVWRPHTVEEDDFVPVAAPEDDEQKVEDDEQKVEDVEDDEQKIEDDEQKIEEDETESLLMGNENKDENNNGMGDEQTGLRRRRLHHSRDDDGQ